MKDDNQPPHKEVGLENQSVWWTVWNKIKNSIFDVLFVLLDNSEDEESMFSIISETGIDYVQMMAFPFSSVVIDVWNASDTLNQVTNFFTIFNVSNYLPGVSFDTFLLVMYSLIFVIVVVISDIVYVAYSFSKKRFTFTFPLIFMAKVVPFFVTVLFLPIMETLLQVVNCSSQGQHQVLQSFPNIVCWQGWHLFHTVVTLVFSSLFVFVSCIVALALFEPRMTTNRLTARQNSTGEVIFIINKIICQFFFSFSPFDGSLPYCVLLFGLSAWLFSAYNVAQPYYDKNATKFFRICSSYYFWTNLILLVSQLLNPLGFQDGLVIWICGMIFIGITIIFERKSNIDTLFSSSLKFKSGEQLEMHLKYVLQLHHNRSQDKNSHMLLLGYIQKHIELCLEEDCPLKYNKKKFTSGKEEEDYTCKQLVKQIQRMYVYGIKKYPECTKLRLAFAFFYMEKQNNNKQAYKQFRKALTTEPSFGEQFIIYRFTKIIGEKHQQQTEKDENDLIEVIRFDNHMSLCEQGMQISGKLHKQFWIQLKQQSPVLHRLSKIGASIIKTSEMIRQNYEEVVKLSGDGPSIIGLQANYAIYLSYISHESIECKKLMAILQRKTEVKKRKGSKLEKSISNDNMQQILTMNKCCVVTEVEDQDNNGEIVYSRIVQVNKLLTELTKYQQKELVGKKLQKILPQVLKTYHDLKVHRWYENFIEKQSRTNQASPSSTLGDSNQSDCQEYVGQQRIGYIRDSANFLRKVLYKVRYFHLQSKFITEMRPVDGDGIYCDSQGIIMEYSKRILLNIPNIPQILSIEDMFDTHILEQLKKQQSKILAVPLQANNRFRIRRTTDEMIFNFQMIEVRFSKQDLEGYKLNLQQLFRHHHKSDTYTKQLAIVINIKRISKKIDTESLFTLRNSMKSEYKKQDRPNCKKTNLDTSLTWMIESQYTEINEMKQSYSMSVFNTQRRGGIREVHEKQAINLNYMKYVNEEGKTCVIKVYRFMKGEFVRMYYDNPDEEESDYDFQEKVSDLQAKIFREKIRDPNFQSSVQKSLRTSINHPEIKCLFLMGILLLFMYLPLIVFSFDFYKSQVIDKGMSAVTKFRSQLSDMEVLTSSLLEILYEKSIMQSTQDRLDGCLMDFNKNSLHIVDSFMLQNKSLRPLNLSSALIRIQANLIKYIRVENFTSSINKAQLDLSTVYYSYLSSVIPKIVQSLGDNSEEHLRNKKNLNILFIYLAVSIVLGMCYVGVWIAASLSIVYKINKILIWFLDIPLDYIDFAEKQCSNYCKITAEVHSSEMLLKILEESEEKEKNHRPIEEDQFKESSRSNDDDNPSQKTENYKTRQLLISKNQKKGLIQYFAANQLMKLTVLIFMACFLGFLVVLFENSDIREERVYKVLQMYGKQYIWVSGTSLVDKISLSKQTNSSSWQVFSQSQLSNLSKNLKSNIQDHKNKEMKKFKAKLIDTTHSLGILEQPVNFQYSNICNLLSDQSEHDECEGMLEGRLKGGYGVFKEYLLNDKNSSDSAILINIAEGLREYVAPGLFGILKVIADNESSSIKNQLFMISIVFYIYVVVVIGFILIPWSLHLRNLNIELNQTMQIVNVIPIELIPIKRKSTRDLLLWIMNEASKIESSS